MGPAAYTNGGEPQAGDSARITCDGLSDGFGGGTRSGSSSVQT
jgi:hypothetical protein